MRSWRSRGLRSSMPPRQTPKTFWSKIKIGGAAECWPWQGATKRGYGHLKFHGKSAIAHRIAYQLHYGVALPRGPLTKDSVIVMHTCDNPPCCNPRHLRLGKNLDNRLDSV